MTRYEAQEITYTVTMPQRARTVFLAIAYYTKKDKNHCFPAVRTIARLAQLSESTVHRAIADLIALGLMSKVTRTRENNGNTSNLYVLTPVPCQADTQGGVNLTDELECTINKSNLSISILTDGRAETAAEPEAETEEITTQPHTSEPIPHEPAALPSKPEITLDEVLTNCELPYIPCEYRQIFRDAVTRLYYSDYLRIGKNIKLPQKVIRESLRYLNYHTLEAASRKLEDAVKYTRREIKNSSQYVTVLLYNAISETDSDLYLKPLFL